MTDGATDRQGAPAGHRAGERRSSPVEQEDPGLLSVLRHYLAPGEAFLDVGANVGVFSIDIALHLGPHGRVYAFEPATDAALDLREQAVRSGVADRIDIFQIALGSQTDRRSLHADLRHPLDWTKRSLFSAGPVVEEVVVRAFDDLVEATEIVLPNGLQAVKIDVEGAEVAVVRGMTNTLRKLRPRILVVETIPDHQTRAGSSVDEIEALLSNLQYSPLPTGSAVDGFIYNTVYVDRDWFDYRTLNNDQDP
jgi:FkbM family methyltransferase